MHLYANTTSPFVRLVRLALLEKGLADRVTVEVVNPWEDPADFLAANPGVVDTRKYLGAGRRAVRDETARLMELLALR